MDIKKRIEIGTTVGLATASVIPIEATSVTVSPAIGTIFGSKRPEYLIVKTAADTIAFSLDGGVVPIEQLRIKFPNLKTLPTLNRTQ